MANDIVISKAHMKKIVSLCHANDTTKTRLEQCFNSLMTRPSINRCDPMSIMKCFGICSRLELLPDPVLEQIALVPFNNSKAGTKELTPIIMYKGAIALMTRAIPSLTFDVGTVYTQDEYVLEEGLEFKFAIKKRWWMKGTDKGGMLFSYCIARRADAAPIVSIVPFAEAMERAKSARSGYKPGTFWYDHFEKMAEKTAILKTQRVLPMDVNKSDELRSLALAQRVEYATEEDNDDNFGDILCDVMPESPPIDDIPTGTRSTRKNNKQFYDKPNNQEDVPPSDQPNDQPFEEPMS